MVLPDDYADPKSPIWWQWLKWLSIPLLVVVLGAVYLSDVWHAAFWLTEAEREREAVFTTFEAASIFILQVGRWPENEQDFRRRLASKIGRSGGTYYRWPDDAGRILRLVHVDYGIPLEKIQQANPKDFPYIYSKKFGRNAYWQTMAERLIGSSNSRIEGEKIQNAVVPKFDASKADKANDGKNAPPPASKK